jgi:hypothetical protein
VRGVWGARAAARRDRATAGEGRAGGRGRRHEVRRRWRAAAGAVTREGGGSRGTGTGRTTPRHASGRIARRDATPRWIRRTADRPDAAAPPRCRRSAAALRRSRRRRARRQSPRADLGGPPGPGVGPQPSQHPSIVPHRVVPFGSLDNLNHPTKLRVMHEVPERCGPNCSLADSGMLVEGGTCAGHVVPRGVKMGRVEARPDQCELRHDGGGHDSAGKARRETSGTNRTPPPERSCHPVDVRSRITSSCSD